MNLFSSFIKQKTFLTSIKYNLLGYSLQNIRYDIKIIKASINFSLQYTDA